MRALRIFKDEDIPTGLDPGDAAGFLQGAWGTAGSLAASFVAIVLARQAIKLSERQNSDQGETDLKIQEQQDKSIAIQKEQTEILVRSTPEYAVSFEAAAANMRLDTLQILIGSYERKCYRNNPASTDSLFNTYSPQSINEEVKLRIKFEIFNSQLVKLCSEIAEKINGSESKLHIEALAAELTLGQRFSFDKLMIDELISCTRDLIDKAFDQVTSHLGSDSSRYLTSYSIYANKAIAHGQEVLSEASYYFIYILHQQVRRLKYRYEELAHLTKAIDKSISKTEVLAVHEMPDFNTIRSTGTCILTPFDFNRGKVLSALKESKLAYLEPFRGQPDLAVSFAISGSNQPGAPHPTHIVIDQTEQHNDSISKERWITFEEHLLVWLKARDLWRLMDLLKKSWFDPQSINKYDNLPLNSVNNFLLTLDKDPESSVGHSIDCIFPRFSALGIGPAITTSESADTNYELVFLEIAKRLSLSSLNLSPSMEVEQFVLEFIQLLTGIVESRQAADESARQKLREVFDKYKHLAIPVIQELAKRPYFDRPFYGWHLPMPHDVPSRNTANDVQIQFVGIHYLRETSEGYEFDETPLFKWLSAQVDPLGGVRKVNVLTLN